MKTFQQFQNQLISKSVWYVRLTKRVPCLILQSKDCPNLKNVWSYVKTMFMSSWGHILKITKPFWNLCQSTTSNVRAFTRTKIKYKIMCANRQILIRLQFKFWRSIPELICPLALIRRPVALYAKRRETVKEIGNWPSLQQNRDRRLSMRKP